MERKVMKTGWTMVAAAVLLAMVLVLGGIVWPEMAMVAWADNGVSYREASWNENTNTVSYTNRTADNVTKVVSASEEAVTWTGGWYVVDTDATITNRITVDGNVNLILADGKTLTASNGIKVPGNKSLTIYGQEAGTGKLISNPPNNTDVAAIGRDCIKLKTITLKTKKLKTVSTAAFRNIHPRAVIKCPDGKAKKYAKLLRTAGIAETVKVK